MTRPNQSSGKNDNMIWMIFGLLAIAGLAAIITGVIP